MRSARAKLQLCITTGTTAASVSGWSGPTLASYLFPHLAPEDVPWPSPPQRRSSPLRRMNRTTAQSRRRARSRRRRRHLSSRRQSRGPAKTSCVHGACCASIATAAAQAEVRCRRPSSQRRPKSCAEFSARRPASRLFVERRCSGILGMGGHVPRMCVCCRPRQRIRQAAAKV